MFSCCTFFDYVTFKNFQLLSPTEKKLPTDFKFFSYADPSVGQRNLKQNNCGKMIFNGFMNQ